MCEPTKLKFDLPIGTWGTTEVEVEYPWHRDLDSIILPLLESAHDAQQERQKEHRELRRGETFRNSHAPEDRLGELKSSGEIRAALPAERDRGTIPAANAAKIMTSNTKRKKGRDKILPSRPNEEVRVCLKGVESIKWMTMMRGDYFQNLLEAYAKDCEPPKEVARLKVFWKGKWVKNMETPDDLGLDSDSKLEIYELVHMRPRISMEALKVPYIHQRNPSKASIKTIQSNISEEPCSPKSSPAVPVVETIDTSQSRSLPPPPEKDRRRLTRGALNVDTVNFPKSSGYPTEDESGLSATVHPGELHMPAQVLTRENSGHTNKTNTTFRSSNESGSLAAEYQAQCVAIHALRSETPNNASTEEPAVVKLSVQPPSDASLQEAARLQVPVSSKLRRHFDISVPTLRSESPSQNIPAPSQTQLQSLHSRSKSPTRPGPTPIKTTHHTIHPAHRKHGGPHSASSPAAPFIPPLKTVKSQEDGIRESVHGFKYQNAVMQRNSMLVPAEIETTIEAPGGRRVSNISNTFRDSWP
ncbi:uncharacterized protein MYCFIDRAFT_216178 [Pseudocercospora fijiensis CIRAD86]|uniref:Ubiquitin-like domain-containing protein n=1 Tax=Pseudocercospora fijiensis (strain CIRAD86) TaxID=383855 RepID=M2ZMK3_PSEFD|nr:uncharacterized protein MYCFIDRAFT_216178 [Pseudocercospora fijiensis CIRAD86]EME80314.1 hypothetical protein MYCFIDRAFT_216178 [Pseudocercospora fijiensis CIRAD86]